MEKRIFKNNFIYFFAIVISLTNLILLVDASRLFQFENVFDYLIALFFLLNLTTILLLILSSKKSVVTFTITNLISLVLVINSFYKASGVIDENLMKSLIGVTILVLLFYLSAMIVVIKFTIKKNEIDLDIK